MPTTLDDQLRATLDAVRDDDGGELPPSPPALAEADPSRLAVALATTDGQVYSAGDDEVELTIQSVSKALVYALICEEHGIEEVLRHIDVEPSGEAYDVLEVEPESKRPRNPMINAGALAAHALVGGSSATEDARVERIRERFSVMAGRELQIDEQTAKDERAEAHTNLAIAHILRAEGVMPDEPEEVVTGYIRQCAILVTTRDLALMVATLANGGTQPVSGERVFSPEVARHTLSVMVTCGMYDDAGDWVSEIGLPAKSGVAGAIVGALPGRVGLAAFSPRLDDHGNSVRGRETFTRLSQELDLHLLADPHRTDTLWHTLREASLEAGTVEAGEVEAGSGEAGTAEADD